MKTILTIILIFSFSNLYAVEGYKSLKFGMSKDDVLKSGICTLKELSQDLTKPWFNTLRCNDLNMFGKLTTAYVYLIDGKFQRIAIDIDSDDLSYLIDSVVKKYGYRTSPPADVNIAKEIKKPNAKIWVGFDNDTVNIFMTTNSINRLFVFLIYSSTEYNDGLLSHETKAMENDI